MGSDLAARTMLRPVTSADRQFMRRLYMDSRPEWNGVDLPSPVRDQLINQQIEFRDAQLRFTFPESLDQVIMSGAAPIGRLWVERSTSEWRVLDIAVLTGYQGCGIGSRLLGDLGRQADHAGAAVSLQVWSENVRALALYRRLGFAPVEFDEAPGYLSMTRTAVPGRVPV